MIGQMEKIQDKKSGQEVAKQSGQAGLSRFHVDYWKERLYRKTFTRDGKCCEVLEWSVRLQHLGRREAFALPCALRYPGPLAAAWPDRIRRAELSF